MDFETLYPAIPSFARNVAIRARLFSMVGSPQVSTDSELEDFEALAEDEKDTRRAFADPPNDAMAKRGLTVAYNVGFESQRLSGLANWMREYAGKIARIQDLLWDLRSFGRKHVYHPRLKGSFALMAVRPALAPGSSYLDLEERRRLKAALLAHCRQDALAIGRMRGGLRAMASVGNRIVGKREYQD